MKLADANGVEMGVIETTPSATPTAEPTVTPIATVSASPSPVVFDPIIAPETGSNWWIWLLVVLGLIVGVVTLYLRGKK